MFKIYVLYQFKIYVSSANMSWKNISSVLNTLEKLWIMINKLSHTTI